MSSTCFQIQIPFRHHGLPSSAVTPAKKIHDNRLVCLSRFPDAIQKFNRLKAWMESQGAYIHFVRLAYFNDILEGRSYRGITTSKNRIADDEQFLGVPHTLVLSCKKAAQHKRFGPLIREFERLRIPTSTSLRVGMWLYYEFMKGRKSFYFPYIDMLPTLEQMQEEGGPLDLWTPEELRLLECPFLEDLVYQQKAMVANAHQKVIYPLWIRYVSTKIPAPTFEQLIFYNALAASRSFCLNEKETVLVPLVDLINHTFQEKRTRARIYRDGEQNFAVYAKRMFFRKSPILTTYGNLSNAYMLHYYGLVFSNNKYDILFLDCTRFIDGLPATVVDFYKSDGAFRTDGKGHVARFQPLTQHLKQVITITAMDYFKMEGDDLYDCILSETLQHLTKRDAFGESDLLIVEPFHMRHAIARRFRETQKDLINREYLILNGEFDKLDPQDPRIRTARDRRIQVKRLKNIP